MSFKLRITLGGLMMFAQDRKHGLLHVIVPRTGPHMHGGAGTAGRAHVGQHGTRILFARKHGRSAEHLRGFRWDLSGVVAGASAAPAYPAGKRLLNLQETTREPVRLARQYVADDPGARVVDAHIILRGGELIATQEADFELDTPDGRTSGPVRLVTLLQWSAEVRGDALPAMTLTPLDTTGEQKAFRAVRADGDDVHLGVVTALEGDLEQLRDDLHAFETPRAPYDGVDHFAAYFEPWPEITSWRVPRPVSMPIYPRICETVTVDLA